jgi:hypothetical protein
MAADFQGHDMTDYNAKTPENWPPGLPYYPSQPGEPEAPPPCDDDDPSYSMNAPDKTAQTYKATWTVAAAADGVEATPEDAAPMLDPTAPRRHFTLHSAAEALLPQPPTEWIVKELLAESTVSLIVGKPGSKKTWVLIDLCVAVAQGEKWINYTTTAAPVLIIDEESGNKSVLRRLGAAMRGHEANADLNVSFITLEHIDMRQPDDIEAIEALIIQTGARLVIIDALADIMPGGDENAVQFVQPVFMALRGIAERTNACIMLVHHTAKAGGYRGSSAMDGAIDVMLMIESEPESKTITFKTAKVRDILPQEFKATANFETLPGCTEVYKFNLSPGAAENEVAATRLNENQEFVISFLAANGDATIKDIQDAVTYCSPEAARLAVYALAKPSMGYVIRTNTGGKGRSAEYGLTQKGKDYATNL